VTNPGEYPPQEGQNAPHHDPWSKPPAVQPPPGYAPPGPPGQWPGQYPQPGYGPPQPYGAPPQYGQPPYGQPPQYNYQGYGQPQSRATNGMAIASMVLGILWLYWVGSILALIFGYIARSQIRQRNEGGNGMAIAGIVLGWIGVGTLILVIILAAAGTYSYP
jgi:hypothetical protein